MALTRINNQALPTLEHSKMPSGSVLQVKQLVHEDMLSKTGSNFEDVTNFSLSITPKFSTSKIMIDLQLANAQSASNTIIYRLLRDTTIISENPNPTSVDSYVNHYAAGVGFLHLYRGFLDSPATTSAITYKLQWRVDANTGYLNRHASGTAYGGTSTLTLTEIAG